MREEAGIARQQAAGDIQVVSRGTVRNRAQYVAKFDPLAKLSRDESRLLIRQRTAGMAVEDFAFLETQLLKHSAGNPRTLLRMVNRLRRAPAITPQVVRWAHVPGARPQFNLTPLLLIPLAVLGIAYYLVPDLEDIEFFVLGGITATLVVGVQLFRTRRQ